MPITPPRDLTSKSTTSDAPEPATRTIDPAFADQRPGPHHRGCGRLAGTKHRDRSHPRFTETALRGNEHPAPGTRPTGTRRPR
jgi:hypothetical protein